MDPSNNFYSYRTALRGANQRSATAHTTREKVGLLINLVYLTHTHTHCWDSCWSFEDGFQNNKLCRAVSLGRVFRPEDYYDVDVINYEIVDIVLSFYKNGFSSLKVKNYIFFFPHFSVSN